MSIRRGLVRRLDWRAAMVRRFARPGVSQMRFMFIVKSAQSRPPKPQLLEAMHKLADREIKAGRILDNDAALPLAMGAQVRIKDGQLNVIDGPFVEAKEVIGGYAVF